VEKERAKTSMIEKRNQVKCNIETSKEAWPRWKHIERSWIEAEDTSKEG